MDNLPLLRDIHLPPEVSALPPGYGWGVIALGLLSLFFMLRLYKYVRLKSRKLYALKLLKDARGDDLASVCRVSEILRRICLLKYPEASVLFGQEWINFLNARSRKKLDDKLANLLIYAPYMPKEDQYKEKDYRMLKQFVAAWIGENL